jgi:hypothetical protein
MRQRRRCQKHGKALFRTKAQAQKTNWWRGGVMNVYACTEHLNRWHIGHKRTGSLFPGGRMP